MMDAQIILPTTIYTIQEDFILFLILLSYFQNFHYQVIIHLHPQYHYLHHHLLIKFMFKMV
jgi:hypothetical protein